MKDSNPDLPTSIYEGEMIISGVTLRTYVLADGRRIINADDVRKLFTAWGSGQPLEAGDAIALAAWVESQGGQ